ncbi:MAG: hypothetical protein ACI88G_001299 [Woeseiaceae bacterium]
MNDQSGGTPVTQIPREAMAASRLSNNKMPQENNKPPHQDRDFQ